MAKNWGYLLKVWVLKKGEEEEAGLVEADGISPYMFASGTQSAVMESEKYDHFSNAMAIADFVSKIGDKNVLSIKKARCRLSFLFLEAHLKKIVLPGIYLSVTPLSAIPSQVQGDERKRALASNSLEYIMLIKVSVPYAWIHPSVEGYEGILYDYISFEVKGEINRYYKEKDY